jgi:hypothetical protein
MPIQYLAFPGPFATATVMLEPAFTVGLEVPLIVIVGLLGPSTALHSSRHQNSRAPITVVGTLTRTSLRRIPRQRQ